MPPKREPDFPVRPSLPLRPHPWRLVFFEELQVNDIRITADGAVFDVLLVGAGGAVYGDDDAFAAGRADGTVVNVTKKAGSPLALRLIQAVRRR